jgi:hypothetical protein
MNLRVRKPLVYSSFCHRDLTKSCTVARKAEVWQATAAAMVRRRPSTTTPLMTPLHHPSRTKRLGLDQDNSLIFIKVESSISSRAVGIKTQNTPSPELISASHPAINDPRLRKPHRTVD